MKNKIAKKFFAYLAKHYPVMCASGAYSMMPPVTESSKWLDRLDDVSRRGILTHVDSLLAFRRDFLAAADKTKDPAERAENLALALSAGGAATELDGNRQWERSPEFYLQVAFTGLEQAADMPAKNDKVRQKRFIKRLRAIPALLANAPENIEATTSTSRATSQTMIRDCARYLTDLGRHELGQAGKAPRFLAEGLDALRDFDRFVTSRPEVPDSEGPTFETMAELVLGTDRTAHQIAALAETEFERRLDALRGLEARIGGDWKAIYEAYQGPDVDNLEPLDLIIREIHRLRSFVQNGPLSGAFVDAGLRIDPQPLHLASTLRPIHYDPALGAWEDEPSRCYVSPHLFSGNRFRDNRVRLARVRKEFPFMAATQTYPGRHLLDAQRHSLGDSPLSQTTNPLFMAGWLSFSEDLLDELGYLENDRDRLVHQARALRRAALARVDAGLAAGSLDLDRCLAILDEAGLSREEGLAQIRIIRLAPAKRAMHVLGLHEIVRLRQAWNLDLVPFCRRLFANGQLPFSCLGQG